MGKIGGDGKLWKLNLMEMMELMEKERLEIARKTN
jgi:hypothetical protein